MTAIEHHIVLGSDEGVILVAGAIADPWTDSTLLAIQPETHSRDEGDQADRTGEDYESDTVKGNDIWILTGDQWGPFSVTARVLDTPPGEPDGEWADVTEARLTSRGGLHITELVDQDDGIVLDAPAGTYRLRVCATGRTPGGSDADLDEDLKEDLNVAVEEEPVERYLIELWPTTDQAPLVDVRETSSYARAVRAGPPPELAVDGAEEGLAASTRIGRDVDHAPGARTLTGRTGDISVTRRIPETRRRLYTRFRAVVPISHHVSSWSFMSGQDWDQVGATTYTATNEVHPDQLSGSRGIIRNISVEEVSPARHVRRTAWLVPPDGQHSAPILARVPLFQPDTTVTTTYEQVKDEHGQAWTTVTVHHADLPIEWIEDMRTWWAYQLAFLAAEFASRT